MNRMSVVASMRLSAWLSVGGFFPLWHDEAERSTRHMVANNPKRDLNEVIREKQKGLENTVQM